ncbi:hypothetical protein AM587_10001032 [Phytophthora nicotianae]|uniref:Uncharacterized protein n=1 Tax=Phytophthora nicotianae TaxID=4792 RepID=A0A0W8DIK1_PHYNI|nr:hypothetical protein AM587_10001032 [Phytophthora nicotianae]
MEMPIPHLALDEGPYDDLLSDSDSGEEDQVDETTEETARWKFIKPPDVQLNVDNTDAFLLSKARLETARVMQRVLSRVFGAQGGHPSQVATVDVLKLWLNQNVLNIVQQHINANLDAKDFISVPELFGFIEVELWLSFYGISPTTFYSKDYRGLYPPAKQAMRSRRYRSILNALGTKTGQIATSEEFWNAPFEADRSLSHAMDALRRVCSEIGFVSEVSIASLDDDLLRLRSRSVEDIGLTRVRNPKKGYEMEYWMYDAMVLIRFLLLVRFGPVHHGVVSLVTGLYLSGHIASRGETLGEVLKLMMRSLCGVSTDSQIDLSGVLFALDRGYQSKAVNQHIIECGGSVIGTHKRVQAFPFTYGKPAQKSQKLINEVGSMSTNWASYKCAGRAGSDTSSNHMHALAFRSGLGKIVLCSTSDKEAGPGKWSYVPRNRNDKANNDSDAFTAFETRVKLLTELQRTPDWFLMRQFRITGLVAIKLLRSIAQQPCQPRDEGDGQVDIYHVLAGMSTVQLVLQILDFPVAAGEEQRDNDGPVRRPLTSDDLLNKKGNELKQMCHDRGLPAYGTIAVLKERLMGQNTASSRAKTPEQPKSVAATLLQAWFLSPKSSTDMKIGTKNEDNISTHVAAFFAAHSALRVRQTKSYGLLAKSDQSYLAFSPDDVADVVDNTESFYAILEYKTRTKSSTAATEKAISAKHGMFTSIRLDTGSNGKQFRRLVPDQAHRSQILHNIIIASLRNGFLVYASKTTILRVVHVIVSEDVAEAYLLALSTIKDKCLSWIYSPDTPLPNFSAEELGHCVDTATLKQHLSLWRALTTKVETRGRPLPAAHQIVPTVIAKWNRVKGGIDVYSRYLKNVKARHAHLAPLAVIWLRILMTLAYNAYQTTQLLEVLFCITNVR